MQDCWRSKHKLKATFSYDILHSYLALLAEQLRFKSSPCVENMTEAMDDRMDGVRDSGNSVLSEWIDDDDNGKHFRNFFFEVV